MKGREHGTHKRATGAGTLGTAAALVTPFGAWCRAQGISPTTGWRWRRDGLVEVVEIRGRPFITRDAETRFLARITGEEGAA